MNPNLETFKKYNQLGVRRSYKPTKNRIEKFKYNSEWESDPDQNVFTLRDYKCCYITIMKNKQGKYRPTVNGAFLCDHLDVIELPKEYDTLEDAQNNAFLFVDTVTGKNK